MKTITQSLLQLHLYKMAEEIFGKSAKQLKQERTVAKSAFTKRANYLSGMADSLTEPELWHEFKALTIGARKVTEANANLRSGLLADIEAANLDEGEEEELNAQQEVGLKKTVTECAKRVDEVREIVRTNLWSRYGEEELVTAIKNAEVACVTADNTSVSALTRDGYEMQLMFAEKVIDACKKLVYWEMWIPETVKVNLRQRVRDSKAYINTLEAKRAEFVFAERKAQEEKMASGLFPKLGSTSTPGVQTTRIVKFKPISLPKFHGCRRDFHRWKGDWESLQRQGEPTGSSEIKKLQPLDSMDERILKDLRLSTHNNTEDIFRVLENRYSNKTMIALEIIENLQRVPPQRENQPRKVIELIQTIEKALADLSDLGQTDAIKNPLVTKSIESKLPHYVKKDWLVFMVDPSNNVTPENHFDNLLKFLKTQEEIMEKLEQLGASESSEKPERRLEKKYSLTWSTSQAEGCVVCGEGTVRNSSSANNLNP